MSLASGKLRHRVTIQRPAYSQDPVTGEQTQSWSDVATVWASIEPLSAKEFIAAQSEQSQISCRIMIRNREIFTNWRIVHTVNGESNYYNIHGVLRDRNSGLEYLTMPCSLGITDGR